MQPSATSDVSAQAPVSAPCNTRSNMGLDNATIQMATAHPNAIELGVKTLRRNITSVHAVLARLGSASVVPKALPGDTCDWRLELDAVWRARRRRQHDLHAKWNTIEVSTSFC